MIEVWNKIDLLQQPLDYAAIEKSDFPVVPVSALLNLNIKKLLKVMEEKSNDFLGKKVIRLKHSIEVHSERLEWLYKFPIISN